MSGITEFDIIHAAETKLRNILTSSAAPAPGSVDFRKWFLQQFVQRGQNEYDCSLEKFAVYFFDAVRQKTYFHLRTAKDIGSPCIEVDEIQTEKNHARISKTASLDSNRESTTNLELQSFPILGTPCGKNFTQVLPRNASTPARKNISQTQQQQQKHIQIHQRRSVDNGNKSFGATSNNSSFDKSRNSTGDGSGSSNSFCLGDFLTSPSVNNRHSSAQKKKLQSNTTSTPNSSSTSKPKKRVVPISVSKTTATTVQHNSPFGMNSSFSQENNILKLSQTEIKDFNKCAVAEAHKALKNDISEVSFVLKAATPTKPHISMDDSKQTIQKVDMPYTPKANIQEEYLTAPITFDKIPSKTAAQLKIIASIYGLLVDMNLTINILREISFLLNLLNVSVPKNQLQKTVNDGNNEIELLHINALEKVYSLKDHNVLELLEEVINSIFFATCVLEEQQQTLALIDTKSLGVVLQCERLVCASPNLKAFLTSVYAQKQALLSIVTTNDISLGGLKNVCFQEDSDSRKFFQSNNEFGAFKTQRDLFYSALKVWDKHHLYPSWNFTLEVTPKIREIFRKSESPVNMTHFAKLFVAQLLISSTEQTSPEEVGIGMEDVDLEKFNKLSQRLVAPSDFSVDYQFPREQAFFRDFIIESRSVPFMEHLKLVLFSELVTFNDSTFEQFNLLAEDGYCESNEKNEFIVRPQVLGSMLILAKFLGFVTALPFQGSTNSETHSTIIQSYQLRLRQLFQTPVNVSELLETAISKGRHLITLPWLVQYLAMLDDVTLQVDSFLEITQKFYTLYTKLGNGELQMTHTSAFIVRCCLGWLFEQKPIIGAGYLSYRITQDNINKVCNKPQEAIVKIPFATTDLQMKSMLDSILNVACPFLAEFRVSIMPAKHAAAKYVSRSGRFRHITPCIVEPPRSSEQNPLEIPSLTNMDENALKNLPNVQSTSKKRQNVLMESFLHAQNNSMRRLILFLSERVYKCVVKDAQYKILLPLKTAADSQVNEITSSDKIEILEQVKEIYKKARCEAYKQWDAQVPEMLNQRTDQGLEALLPIETAAIVKKAYAWHIRTDAGTKIDQWRHINLYKNDFYCNDVIEMTGKICKANANGIIKSNSHTTELKLVKSRPRISDLIEEMQHWLYTTGFETTFQPEIFVHDSVDSEKIIPYQREAALIEFLERLKTSFENTLPTIYYRLIGAGLIQILQHLISKSPMDLTEGLIQAACQFFSLDKIREADAAPTTTDTTTIYHALITPPFIESLGSYHICYEKLKELLCALIQSDVITMDFVNQLFITVFKEDLNVGVFNSISKMLHEIVQKSSNSSTVSKKSLDYDSDNELKSQLFMEVLSDFSRDLDDL